MTALTNRCPLAGTVPVHPYFSLPSGWPHGRYECTCGNFVRAHRSRLRPPGQPGALAGHNVGARILPKEIRSAAEFYALTAERERTSPRVVAVGSARFVPVEGGGVFVLVGGQGSMLTAEQWADVVSL